MDMHMILGQDEGLVGCVFGGKRLGARYLEGGDGSVLRDP